MPNVFISHASTDDAVVTSMYEKITAAGLAAWVDHQKGITYGENWSKAIHAAANDCDFGLFVLSPASAKSEYCEAEWNRILALGKKLYIAMIAPVPVRDVPLRLGTIQYVDLTANFDHNLDELIAAMRGGRDLNPESPAVAQAKYISGAFPRWQLDLPLIGREADLAHVRALITDQRVSAIIGVGGVGKTRLAAEIANTAEFRDGVIWYKISASSSIDGLTLLIRDHLRLPLTASAENIWAMLGQRAALLVLDNAEDAAKPEDYAEWINTLNTAGGTRVLLTSRREWRELKGAKLHPLSAPQLTEAVAILAAFVEREQPAYPPGDYAERMATAAFCHPRLIEYAVDWLKSYPPQYVLDEVLGTLKGADAEQALEEMVGKTLAQVRGVTGGETAINALRRLVVCRGGFTFEAAQAIMDAEPTALALLKQWGLVRLEGGRYSIDPLVIAALEPEPSAHKPHYDFYKALAWAHNDKQDYAGLDVESANLEVAFEWAFAAGDMEAAYWLTNASSDFLANRGRFDQRKDWLERLAARLGIMWEAGVGAWRAMPQQYTDPALIATIQNDLGTLYQSHPLGSRRDNLRRAISAFEAALIYRTPQAAPLDYAMTQNNLANAYTDLSKIEDRDGNLRRAIAAYERALICYTPDAAPLDYAMTQNNLGTAYADLAAIENRAGNLRRAIAAFEQALIYRIPHTAPLAYAMTQSNLANAYTDLAAVDDRAGNLRLAIEAYEQALIYRTPQTAPLNYATTQNNLGIAYSDLAAVEDRADNLRRAIAAFEQALIYRTADAAPLDYAITQNNLGAAYFQLAAGEDRAGNLRRAIGAYEQVLIYYTPDTAPLYYAMTQQNLGIAYEDSGDLSAALTCWREAEKYYRLMDAVGDADLMLRGIADAEARLAGGGGKQRKRWQFWRR